MIHHIAGVLSTFIDLGSFTFFFFMANKSFNLKIINLLLSHKYALYMGCISYGLYVYHIMVIYYATPYIFNPLWHQINWDAFGTLSVLQYHSWLIKLPLFSVFTIVIADLSYRHFEQHILRYKTYFKNESS